MVCNELKHFLVVLSVNLHWNVKQVLLNDLSISWNRNFDFNRVSCLQMRSQNFDQSVKLNSVVTNLSSKSFLQLCVQIDETAVFSVLQSV